MASNGQQFTDPASIYWPISSYGKQDSSFDTGQSPLEWWEIPYLRPLDCLSVCPFVCLSSHPSICPSILLDLRPAWRDLKPGWLALRPGWLAQRPGWLALRPRWLALRPGWLALGPGSKSRGEELTCLFNKRVKWSCFSQKRFWVKFEGVFRPPRTPNTWTGWPLWALNLPNNSLLSQGEKNWLACAIKESNDHVLAKNGHF